MSTAASTLRLVPFTLFWRIQKAAEISIIARKKIGFASSLCNQTEYRLAEKPARSNCPMNSGNDYTLIVDGSPN